MVDHFVVRLDEGENKREKKATKKKNKKKKKAKQEVQNEKEGEVGIDGMGPKEEELL